MFCLDPGTYTHISDLMPASLVPLYPRCFDCEQFWLMPLKERNHKSLWAGEWSPAVMGWHNLSGSMCDEVLASFNRSTYIFPDPFKKFSFELGPGIGMRQQDEIVFHCAG